MAKLKQLNPFNQGSERDGRAERAADGLVALESLIKENEALKTEISRKTSDLSRVGDERHSLLQQLEDCRTTRDHYMRENAKLVATIDSLSAVVAKAHADAHDSPDLIKSTSVERLARDLSEVKPNGGNKSEAAKK